MIKLRIFDLFRRRRLEAELEEELVHHRDALEAEHRGRGLSALEARLAAERDMGGLLQAKDACRDERRIPVVLFGVSPLDAATYAVVTSVLIGAAALAAYVPARRSTRVDPVEALRGE